MGRVDGKLLVDYTIIKFQYINKITRNLRSTS